MLVREWSREDWYGGSRAMALRRVARVAICHYMVARRWAPRVMIPLQEAVRPFPILNAVVAMIRIANRKPFYVLPTRAVSFVSLVTKSRSSRFIAVARNS